jgi:hypothetical protein
MANVILMIINLEVMLLETVSREGRRVLIKGEG